MTISAVPRQCQSCNGTRDVLRVTPLGVEMFMCRHCLKRMGHPVPGEQEEAAREPEQIPANWLELLVNRPPEDTGPPLLATDGRRARCKDCGAEMRWFPTVNGRWLALDPATIPSGQLASHRRCYVDSDGTVHGMGRRNLAQTRVPHREVCPAVSPAPVRPQAKALWEQNRFS